MTTTNAQTLATTPSAWTDINRLRPIEDLFAWAESMKTVFDFVRDFVRRADPAETDSVEVLLEALEAANTANDHAHYLKRGIDAVLLDSDLRAAVWMGLALKGLPGAAGETSQAFAHVAHDLSMFLRRHRASTPEEHDIVGRLVDRIQIARACCVGWAALASGVNVPASHSGTPRAANDLALRIELTIGSYRGKL